MTELGIQFTFDYVDPGSYLSRVLLERWARDRGTSPAVSWRPLELRPPSASRIDPAAARWKTLMEAMEGVAKEEGVAFDPPPSVPWTRKAHELALHAEEKGCFEAVHAALFEAHFTRGLDISRVDVLVEVGREHGLDASETRTVLGTDRFLPAVEEARREALQESIRGVPTIAAGELRLEGLVDGAGLRAFLDEAAARAIRE